MAEKKNPERKKRTAFFIYHDFLLILYKNNEEIIKIIRFYYNYRKTDSQSINQIEFIFENYYKQY
jgi:hypothetical protein